MSILALGDVHSPFCNYEALDEVALIAGQIKPDHIIQVGDLYDFISFGRFARNPNFITPQEECTKGRDVAEDMWKSLRKASPKSKCWQIEGNHDLRPIKYVLDKADMAAHVMKKFVKDMMTFPGVELIPNEEEIDGVVFMHGHAKRGEHAKHNQQNTVCGHSHKPGIDYFKNRSGVYWELNVGWLGDASAEVFDYRKWKRAHGMVNGVGLIDEHGPRFIEL